MYFLVLFSFCKRGWVWIDRGVLRGLFWDECFMEFWVSKKGGGREVLGVNGILINYGIRKRKFFFGLS